MTGPTRAEVLATPPRDADAEIRALLQAAEDCQPEWQERPTRTTTLPSIDDYQEPEMTDDRTTSDNPATSGDAADNLRQRIATVARTVPIRLGPNAVELTLRGQPVLLNMGEADELARVAVDAIRGAYVPPPPGSDRDKLSDHLLAVAAPHMPPYTSTACQMADALEAAAIEHPGLAGELREAAQQQRSSCRITRKQDMAKCQHPQHQEQGR